ncbi:MAG TPA: hypothetical protein VF594_06655 [Rubricoccaceae bacterium]|jgi:hypothetical protein
MRLVSLGLIAFAVFAAFSGCDSVGTEEQLFFENQAFSGVSDGDTDDDWRVAPFFASHVLVIQEATPNPASPGTPNSLVEIIISDSDASGGYAVYRREPSGDLELIQGLEGQSRPGIYAFSFPPSAASETRTEGSKRLIVLDGLQRVVTYGDLVLR